MTEKYIRYMTKKTAPTEYIGVSKSSGNDILLPNFRVDKKFFLHRMIERKMLFLSMLFDRGSINLLI